MERRTPPGQARIIHLVYRQGDVDDTAGRIYDWLVARYGSTVVARDLFGEASELPPEPAARAFLEARMDQVAAQVVVIGPRWLAGIGRPNDLMRVQVEAALRRQLPIIPTLAEGAPMPTSAQLPPDIAPLALFNAAQARLDPDFGADMERLLATIARYAPSLATQPTGAAAPEPKASAPARPWLWPFRTPLRIISTALICLSLLILLLGLLLPSSGNQLAARALVAAPPPTATYLATPSAAGSYYATLTDGMPDWLTGGQCQPKSDGLHIVNSDHGCDAPDTAASGDGDLAVVARQTSGALDEPFGLYFRSPPFGGEFYALLITSDGRWSASKQLYKSFAYLTDWRYTAAIHTGLNVTNTIEVRFKGARLTFLINGQQVGAVSDSSIPAQGTAADPGPNTGDGLFGHTGIEVIYTDYRLRPVT
jgi:hypothetical protein